MTVRAFPYKIVSLAQAAPLANAVIADSGVISGGTRDVELILSMSCHDTNAVGKGMVVEHRNAANNATLQVLGGCPSPGQNYIYIQAYRLLGSERIRIIAGSAAGAAASQYVAAILWRL